MSKPNIYDVAKLAGVSHQTVSRVVNQSSALRESTRQRVEQAMQELGYVPSAAARTLGTSKSRMIGILVSDLGFNGPASILHAMQDQARADGYFTVVVSVDPEDQGSLKSSISQLRTLGIEGLIVITPHSDFVELFQQQFKNIPVIYLDSPRGETKLSVTVDNYQAAVIATRHLIDLGHKKLLHVAGPTNWFDASARKQGFEAACIASQVDYSVIVANWSIEAGLKIGREFDVNSATAIFAANDHLALGILTALAERKIQVPRDVSLIGFDDIPEAAYFQPPLTTMRPDFKATGSVAMGLMLGELSSENSAQSNGLIPQLIVRKSTAEPKGK